MEADRLKRALLSLGDAALRTAWLTAELEGLGHAPAGRVLDRLAEESQAGGADAREALHSVVMVLIDPDRSDLVESLRREVAEQRLFSLDRLVRRAPPPSIHAPPPDEIRLPDYGRGRELSLGERKSLARRPDRRAFEKLCLDPHPMVIRQLLENPKMVEDDAIRIAILRPARLEAIRELARSHRWMARPRVRMAIVFNPGAPPEVAIPLLALCNREELRDILKSTETQVVLRATAQEFLALRPPMPHAEPGTVH